MHSPQPAQWPEDVPKDLSKAILKPILLTLLDPTDVVQRFDFIPHSAWPNSTQVNHYLFDCRCETAEQAEALRQIAKQVIVAAKEDEDIKACWEFLTDCGLGLRLSVYDDPGISCLRLQIVRSAEAEARLRASLAAG